jgi:excinuclease UvrABC nuclease subunit
MIPRFLVGKLLRESPGVNLGPFFTHSDATRFVQVLEDGFDLCRYPQILEQSPHGKACAYFDMGRCPAPCDGTLPMSRYRESVEEAVRFAIADREGVYGRCEAAMREAASRQSYEQAGRIKQRLARLREIEHKAFAHVGPIEQFNWLIVQRGGGRTKVRPFFVQAGMITPGQTVSLRELDKAVAKWLESPIRESRTTACQGLDELQSRSEQIWLVSHYLGKSKTPGLFLHANRLPSCADLAARIRECFRKPEPPTEVDPPSGMPEPASPPST